MDPLDDLVRSSANFGYLIEHEPMLALDGASAESHIYTDPDAAMFKARRFLEVLSKKAVAVFSVHSGARKLYNRIIDLREAGVIDSNVQSLCDLVRTAGNEAVHSHMRDVETALQVVRHCFDLGLWLHNSITGGQVSKVFVPPQPPDLVPSARDADGPAALQEIQILLSAFERRLVLLEMEHGDAPGRPSEELVPVAAAAMARQASLGKAVRSAKEQFESRHGELAAALDERLAEDQPASASRQDELRRNAGAAADLLVREAKRLRQIAQEIAQGAQEGGSVDATSVINVAGDRSNNFVVGRIYGSTVNPTFREGRRP